MAGKQERTTEADGRSRGEVSGGGRPGNDLLETGQLRGIDEEGRLRGGTHGGPKTEHRIEGQDLPDVDMPEVGQQGPPQQRVGSKAGSTDGPQGRVPYGSSAAARTPSFAAPLPVEPEGSVEGPPAAKSLAGGPGTHREPRIPRLAALVVASLAGLALAALRRRR
jgi:hypothetical protein